MNYNTCNLILCSKCMNSGETSYILDWMCWFNSPWSDRGTRRTTAALPAAALQKRPQPAAEHWLTPHTGSRGRGPPHTPHSHICSAGCPTHCPHYGPQEGAASSHPLPSRTLPLSPPRLSPHPPGPHPSRTSWRESQTEEMH